MRSMKKILLSVFAFVLFSTAGFAHEFWLDPVSFFSKNACVRFRVGEHFSGNNWSGNFEKVRLLEVLNHTDRSTTNAQQMLPNQGDSLQFSLPFTGTQLLVYNGSNSYIELPASEFNAYLQEDGLTDIAAWRKANGQDTARSREYYQRSVKTLLQNGTQLTPCNYPTELPLDIVPLQHPYSLTKAGSISFQVYFQQRLLKQALIRTWHISSSGKLTAGSIAMTDGSFTLPVTPDGKWMVSLVKMVPNKADDKADWQSYWGSFTWGYY